VCSGTSKTELTRSRRPKTERQSQNSKDVCRLKKMESYMDQFLARFRIKHLKAQLLNEGVDHPEAFDTLDREDITGFIRRQKKALGLGDISKLRKAWKEIKRNGWSETLGATESERAGVVPTSQTQSSMLRCSLCPGELGTLGGSLNLKHKCGVEVRQLDELRKNPNFKLRMRCPFVGCTSTFNVYRSGASKFPSLWKHVWTQHFKNTEKKQFKKQFKDLFRLFLELQGLKYTPRKTQARKKKEQTKDSQTRVDVDVGPGDHVVPDTPDSGQSSDGLAVSPSRPKPPMPPSQSTRTKQRPMLSGGSFDPWAPEAFWADPHLSPSSDGVADSPSKSDPPKPFYSSPFGGVIGDYLVDSFLPQPSFAMGDGSEESLNDLLHYNVVSPPAYRDQDAKTDSTRPIRDSKVVSPPAYRDQDAKTDSTRPVRDSKVTETPADKFGTVGGLRRYLVEKLGIRHHNGEIRKIHRQRSLSSRRRRLLSWVPNRRLPLCRILRRDKNGRRATKWQMSSRFGSRIFELRKRTLSSRSQNDNGDRKRRRRRK